MSSIWSREEVDQRIQTWKESGETVVFTNGCFDLLHVGHLRTLRRAKSEGTRLVVGVNSDGSVKRLKGPTRPINNHFDRAELLSALSCVDAVVVFEEDTPIKLLEQVRPNVHVKGGDYSVDDLPEKETVEKYGGRIVIIELVPDRSTTNLILKSQSS